MLEPALDDFGHHPKVVGSVALHAIGPVLLLGRPALAQHHRGADTLVTSQLSHIEADDVVQRVQFEHLRAVIRGSLLQTAGTALPVACDLDIGVLVGHLAQPCQLTALGHSDLDRAAAPLDEPAPHRLSDGGRDQHGSRRAGACVVLCQNEGNRFGDVATVNQGVLQLALDDAVLGVEDHHYTDVAARGEANGVAVLVEPAVDDLLRDGPLDCANQIPRLGSALVIKRL